VVRQAAEPEPSLDEPEFVDTVSKNLRSGRCLLLIVGDGIQEDAEGMAEFLQQHAGAHFALAMVGLAVYEVPSTGQRLVVPSVPLRTTNIVRGIVRIDGSGVSVIAPPPETQADRATTLTEDEFFSKLENLRPGTATALRNFLDSLDDLHVEYEVRKYLVVRMVVQDLRVLPFCIRPDGVVETGWTFGKKELLRPFTVRLAASVPGAFAKETPKTWYVPHKKSDGSFLTVWDILENQTAWREALEALFHSMTASYDG
jgi:hypothetical protein